VLKQGANKSELSLIQHCRERLSGYKKPKSIEFVDDLPKNANGKVLRRELKEPFWSHLERRV